MFDIGFWELAIIGVVTLIVVGPERMPALARTAGKWFGRLSRFITSVKSDIDRELKAEEMKKAMAKHTESAGLHDIIEETKADMADIKQTTDEVVSATNEAAQEAENHAPESATDGDNPEKETTRS